MGSILQTVMKLLYMYSYDDMMEKIIEGCILRKGGESRKQKERPLKPYRMVCMISPQLILCRKCTEFLYIIFKLFIKCICMIISKNWT